MIPYKTAVKSLFRRFGLDVRRYTPVAPDVQVINPDTMRAGLQRSQARGVQPGTIIDVGAAAGLWSLMTEEIFSGCSFLLLEPLEERRFELQQLAQQHPRFHVVHAGASSGAGEVNFYVAGDLDGSAIVGAETIGPTWAIGPTRRVPVTTIDAEIHRLALPGPYLLKLDTHGHEVPILAGAHETLKQTELVVMECYGLRIMTGALTLWEMCDHMLQRGFRLIDLVDNLRRPSDGLLWQCDAIFAPTAHPSFAINSYWQ